MCFSRVPLLVFMTIALLNITSSVAQPADSNYRQAEYMFNSALSLEQRVLFQVLLTASGQSNAVPVERFTPRLFDAIKRFQSANALVPTGMPDEPFFDRLFLLATPMLNLWGFQWVGHPWRGYKIWAPIGLGLMKATNEFGLAFEDSKKRIRIDFTTVPNVDIGRNFFALIDGLSKDGAKIHYRVIKSDWFVISFTTASGVDAYARYHQDGSNVTGFSLYWDNRNGNINGERVAILLTSLKYRRQLEL